MEKKVLIVLFILLSGCQNKEKLVTCSCLLQDKAIYIDIHAKYDDIQSVEVKETFEIPNKVMADKEKLDFLVKQLDSTYHFENNTLVKTYSVVIDDVYSLDSTIEALKLRRFYCE